MLVLVSTVQSLTLFYTVPHCMRYALLLDTETFKKAPPTETFKTSSFLY